MANDKQWPENLSNYDLHRAVENAENVYLAELDHQNYVLECEDGVLPDEIHDMQQTLNKYLRHWDELMEELVRRIRAGGTDE